MPSTTVCAQCHDGNDLPVVAWSGFTPVANNLTFTHAGHLAAGSGVGMEIALERIPCWPGVPSLTAAASGEEYELLVAMPPAFGETQARAFTGLVGVALTRIGSCVVGAGVRFTDRGTPVTPPAGYDHFA